MEDNDQAEIRCRDDVATITAHVGRDPQSLQLLHAKVTDQLAGLAMLVEAVDLLWSRRAHRGAIAPTVRAAPRPRDGIQVSVVRIALANLHDQGVRVGPVCWAS